MPTGVDRVCLAYVHFFQFRARALIIRGGFALALSPDASAALFDWLLGWVCGNTESGNFGKAVMALLKLPLRSVPRGSWVLNMGHSGLDRQSYWGWLKRRQIRLIVMAHDLIPITHPQFCQRDATERHIKRLRVILEQAAGVVSNSRHTADMLSAYAQQAGMDVPPLAVIPLGMKKRWPGHVGAPQDTVSPYFVMVGTLEPRKNHAFILYLWQRMRHEWPAAQIPRLIIIGQIGWMCGTVVHQLLHDEHLRDFVRLLTDCTDERLTQYLRHAQALLFPSHAEGYGLPLIEALALGTPVLASPLPVFREVAGDTPEYLDLDDEDAWLAAIRGYALPLDARRDAQLARLQDFSVPTWEQHFDAFEHFVSGL